MQLLKIVVVGREKNAVLANRRHEMDRIFYPGTAHVSRDKYLMSVSAQQADEQGFNRIVIQVKSHRSRDEPAPPASESYSTSWDCICNLDDSCRWPRRSVLRAHGRQESPAGLIRSRQSLLVPLPAASRNWQPL